MPFRRGAIRGHSTVAPPIVNIQPIRAFLPAFQSMSSNAKAVTLEELQKGGGGSFTIKPAVTIAAVGRRRFAYHSCVECRKKTNQNTEGRYGCVQHPTAKTTARYCLRIQLKQEDISMWSTAFHDVAESILGVSVEDFEELNDDQRRTVVWPAIGMQYNSGSSVGRMPDSQSREPGFEPHCYRFEVWAFSFTSRRLSRLSCINEYLAIDSGGNVSE